jgi:histidinol-phosphate aminotransferase
MSPYPRPGYQAISRYAPDRRPIEVDLSDNTNRWGAHPAALRVIEGAATEDLTRYPPVYADELRRAVAETFDLAMDSVTTGCGSDDLLDSSFRAAGEPGESLSYLDPSFSMVETFARMNGMEPRPVLWEAGLHWETMLEGDPALIYLCRPNNPTGEELPRDWIEGLMEAVGPDGPIVLVDEAYADFADDPLLSDAPGSDRLVVLRTFSKAYGLAGLRVGFAVGPPDVIEEIEKSRGPYKVARLAERAAVAALRDTEGWTAEVVERIRAERARLREELRRRGWSPPESGGNFLLLPLQGRSAVEVSVALRERGVAVRPFPALPAFGDSIRISIGPRTEIDRCLMALDEVLA